MKISQAAVLTVLGDGHTALFWEDRWLYARRRAQSISHNTK